MIESIKLVGDRVRKARKFKNLSQLSLSEKIGISQSNLSFIEGNRHNASEDVVNSLCSILGVSKEWITGESMDGGVPMDDMPNVSQIEREDISNRFIDSYERLKTLGIINNDADFAEFANIPRSTLSLALAKKNPISLEWVPFLEEKGANRDYIYNNMLPILRLNRSRRVKDTDDIVKNVNILVMSIEEDMKLLKSYLSQIL